MRHVPFEFWPESSQRGLRAEFGIRGSVAAGQIRERMRQMPCSCLEPGELAADGRCTRCWGWPRSAEDGDRG
jgi:hypothetical protein